jgi:RNA polymerase sigma-70 factor (ECF subfamily)
MIVDTGMATTGETGDAVPARTREDPLRLGFLRGEVQTVAGLAGIISGVIGSRGYFVPQDERPDIHQEVMLQLWREAGRTDWSFDGPFEVFARTVAHRRCVDWLRRRRDTAELPGDAAAPGGGPEDRIVRQEKAELGKRVLETIRRPCRQLFRLHVVKDMTYREIAAREGRSEGALRVQMSECLKEARRLLDRLRTRPAARRGPES